MLPGPDDITRRELSNGMVVLVRENHSAQSVVITGSLNAGSIFEPDETLGLAAFTASSLMRGTEKRDFATIHELLESSGASLGISSGVHTIGFSGKSLSEDLPMLLELLADALRCPSFPERQIERLRGEIITSIKAHEQDTHYMAGRLFRELAYPVGHPYYRASEGRIDTISAITREQLRAYQQHMFGPKGMVLVIVGSIDTEAAFQLVQEQFGDWVSDTQPDGQSLPLIEPLDSIRSQTLVMPGKSQVDLVLGIAGPSRYAEDWEAASLGNSILGVFGMYGRIGAEVREKRGMAYYSFSRIDGGPGPGAWRVVAGVNPVNVQAALLAIRGEIDRITSELVTDDELADNKANFIGRLPLTLESNEGVAGTILAIERYNLGLDYLWHYADRVNAITAEAVLLAARHYLSPTAYALSIAGPEIELDTSLL